MPGLIRSELEGNYREAQTPGGEKILTTNIFESCMWETHLPPASLRGKQPKLCLQEVAFDLHEMSSVVGFSLKLYLLMTNEAWEPSDSGKISSALVCIIHMSY